MSKCQIVGNLMHWLIIVFSIDAGFLYKLTDLIVESMSLGKSEAGEQEFLKVITTPFTHLIIQVNQREREIDRER